MLLNSSFNLLSGFYNIIYIYIICSFGTLWRVSFPAKFVACGLELGKK